MVGRVQGVVKFGRNFLCDAIQCQAAGRGELDDLAADRRWQFGPAIDDGLQIGVQWCRAGFWAGGFWVVLIFGGFNGVFRACIAQYIDMFVGTRVEKREQCDAKQSLLRIGRPGQQGSG